MPACQTLPPLAALFARDDTHLLQAGDGVVFTANNLGQGVFLDAHAEIAAILDARNVQLNPDTQLAGEGPGELSRENAGDGVQLVGFATTHQVDLLLEVVEFFPDALGQGFQFLRRRNGAVGRW